MAVHDGVKQPFGIVHGGAYAALAESLCSRATFETVRPQMAMGQANESMFLRPAFSGTIHARGRALHRGRTSWVWDVEMTDDEGRLCATLTPDHRRPPARGVTPGVDFGRSSDEMRIDDTWRRKSANRRGYGDATPRSGS